MYILLGRRGTDGRAEAPRLLRQAVLERFGLEELPETARGERGKPWFPARPDIHFNLSHSGGVCLCAVGDRPVGVDIELIRPRPAGLARRIFSDGEYGWYEARGCVPGDFYTLWTRKESFAKYTGRGVADVRAVVPPLPGQDCCRCGVTVRSWEGEDWRAALCGEGPAPEAISWR